MENEEEMISLVRNCISQGRKPLIVVVGATGTGKTKLAVDVAKKFQGEVLSADSMQLYKGIPIGTNQATAEETQGVPHHFIGTLDPLRFDWNVAQFRNQALQCLEAIWDAGKLPVVAGGTMQYVEAILWDCLIELNDEHENYGADLIPEAIRNLPTEQLFAELQRIDPMQAEYTSPTNRRRIFRALEVFYSTGKSWEAHIREQQESFGGDKTRLRFPDSRILWLDAEPEVLSERLDRRVDQMVNLGLEKEITDFYDAHSEEYFAKVKALSKLGVTEEEALDKGIFQSIALKEFRAFLALPAAERETENGRRLFREGEERLRIATRQYTKRQNRWIRRRFLRGTGEPPTFKLDSSQPELWEEIVQTPAFRITKCLLDYSECDIRPEPVTSRNHSASDIKRVFYCDTCERHVTGIEQWEEHQRSRGHKYTAHKARKSELGKLQRTLGAYAETKRRALSP